MKFTYLTTGAAVCAFILTTGCNKADNQSTGDANLVTYQDSVSYVIGTDIGNSLFEIKDEVKLNVIMQAISDKINGKSPKIDKEQARPIMQKFSTLMQEKQMAKMKADGEKNMAEGKKFLEENKTKSGVITTASGLQYTVLKQGDGPKPTETDKVKVHYQGTLLNGKEFDSSIKRGQPAEFPVTGVIKGWTEALLLMNTGSKFKLFIPSDLAYGERNAGPDIGPNSTLIFEVELLEIVK